MRIETVPGGDVCVAWVVWPVSSSVNPLYSSFICESFVTVLRSLSSGRVSWCNDLFTAPGRKSKCSAREALRERARYCPPRDPSGDSGLHFGVTRFQILGSEMGVNPVVTS